VNLETLKLYCDVVRLRSFSRGAAANTVSQSAASQAIQQLEAELDAVLLDRSRRPLLPTEQGQAFYDSCRTLLQGWEKARAELAAARERVEGTVRVAAIYSVGLHDMSRHMQPFMAAYPQARVLLECLHPHKVVEAVLEDEADVGILSYPCGWSPWCWSRIPPIAWPGGARWPLPSCRARSSWPSTATSRSARPSIGPSSSTGSGSRW
jgi:DNA-binding transcriptional LysR family regulator